MILCPLEAKKSRNWRRMSRDVMCWMLVAGYSLIGYSLIGYSLIGYSLIGYSLIGYSLIGYSLIGYSLIGYFKKSGANVVGFELNLTLPDIFKHIGT